MTSLVETQILTFPFEEARKVRSVNHSITLALLGDNN